MTTENKTTEKRERPAKVARPCSTIHAALCACMGDVEAIGKNRKNKEQGYAYRGIDDLYNSLHPIFARHGVFVTCDTLELQRTERTTKSGSLLQVVYGTYRVTFHAEDGTSVSVQTSAEAMDSGDKATNKASSAALKYALMQTLLIPTEDAKDSEQDTYELQARKEMAKELPPATEDDVLRACAAMRAAGNTKALQQLQALRSLTTRQQADLYVVAQELEAQSRPTLKAMPTASTQTRDAF